MKPELPPARGPGLVNRLRRDTFSDDPIFPPPTLPGLGIQLSVPPSQCLHDRTLSKPCVTSSADMDVTEQTRSPACSTRVEKNGMQRTVVTNRLPDGFSEPGSSEV